MLHETEGVQDLIELRCPLDGGKVRSGPDGHTCSSCDMRFPMVDAGGGKVPDLRCLNLPSQVTMKFEVPQVPAPFEITDQFGTATRAEFACPTREEMRRNYGTKLQKEVLYYISELMRDVGPDAHILDLGCANGGTARFLQDSGFKHVVAVDFLSSGAQLLADVHRLPFENATFDMIVTTATLEHFYNPFVAFVEMGRCLKDRGRLVASGSFWERWHGNSCFHMTPGGIDQLCLCAGLELYDMWSGWGFIPSVAGGALNLGRFRRLGYKCQSLFDALLSWKSGEEVAKLHRYRTSGSLGLYARKTNRAEKN